MMSPLENMRLHEAEFTKSDKRIVEYIEKRLDVIASNSIVGAAEIINVSKSALLRFCKKCGYSGYSELKYDVSRYLLSGQGHVISEGNTTQNLLELYTNKILNLSESISIQQLEQLSNYIINARKIKSFGIHETSLSANYFEYRLMALGLDCQAVTIPHTMVEKANFSSADDVHIFFTISGVTKEIVDAAQTSLDNKAKTIVITSNTHIPYKENIDLLLLVPSMGQHGNIFLDSQPLLTLVIEVIINYLAKKLKD